MIFITLYIAVCILWSIYAGLKEIELFKNTRVICDKYCIFMCMIINLLFCPICIVVASTTLLLDIYK